MLFISDNFEMNSDYILFSLITILMQLGNLESQIYIDQEINEKDIAFLDTRKLSY